MSNEKRCGVLFKWIIENFSFCHHEEGNSLCSPTFLRDKTNGDWCMEIFPRIPVNTESFMSLFLRRYAVGDVKIRISNKIEIIGPSRKILAQFYEKNKLISCRAGKKDIIDIEVVLQDIEEINQDTLTIHCQIYDIDSRKLEPAFYKARTTIAINRQWFRWNVPNTEESFSVSESISFSGSADFEVELNIKEGSFGLFVYRTNVGYCLSHFVQIHLTSLSENGSNTTEFKHFFNLKDCFDKFYDFWECPISLENYDCLSENGFTKIQCEFACSGKFIPDNTSSPTQYPWRQFTVSNNIIDGFPNMQEDAYNMLCERKHCDVKICVSDSMVEAHKSILASRSPVFSTMFDQDMTETQTGVVTIPDIDMSTFNSFLKFLYTDKVDDMTYESASNLILVSEKYQVLSLKHRCANFLISHLKMDNASEMAKLADMVCHNELKSIALEFIVLHSKVIFMLPEWDSWVKNNVELASEIFSKLKEKMVRT